MAHFPSLRFQHIGNGWTGLQLYRLEHPDVIVLDLKMPELDGVTVLKDIRHVDLRQPVIILTGDTTPETEREVRALGVSEFILKGSSLGFLGDTIQRLLMAPDPAAMQRGTTISSLKRRDSHNRGIVFHNSPFSPDVLHAVAFPISVG